MSSWSDSAKWAKYLSKEGCPVCNQTPETRPPTERSIAGLSVSRFIADRDACLKGYCCLVLKPHVIELYELSEEDSAAFMRDVKVASLALKKVTGAVKINYEIHGNTIPHMHLHLYPRQIGDPFENGPVDWRRRIAKTYEEGEFEAFIKRMKTAIKEVEQGAHHIHVRTPTDAKASILFRDYLRSHPDAAARYATLKRELAERYPTDRDAYTEGKARFVDEIIRKALSSFDAVSPGA